jgi:FKBP-type peptidyl-prolyl cis-trans isomerase 2
VTRHAEGPDVDDVLYVVRDNLAKADAFITSVESMIKQPGGGSGGEGEGDEGDEDITGDDEFGRRQNHLVHMINAAKLAVREAQYAGDQMAARLDAHRVESTRPTALSKHRGKV